MPRACTCSRVRHAQLCHSWRLLAQERAEALLGGLGGEQARWTAAAARLRADAVAIVGDALLSAAAVAYLGPFTPAFRRARARGPPASLTVVNAQTS